MAKIQDNTANVLQELENRVTEALSTVGSKIVATAKRIVPVDTGALQRSIEDEASEGVLMIGSDKDYAAKIEIDQPYLRPALMENLDAIAKAFRE